MAVMGPFLSWVVFISVIGAVYFVSQRKKLPPIPVKPSGPLQEKAKPIFVSTSGGGAEAGEKKKAKKKKKSALSNTAAKEVVSTDDGGNKSDDDVAQEVDLKDVARRLKAQGGSTKSAASRRQGEAVSSYPASHASSTGADGDIDEEGASGSADPSDMLEPSAGGSGVLRIGAPTQLPRGQKKKTATSSANDAGLHATKNAKKKEKKKAERDAERAEQQARFEQHRKAMRAEEAAQQKNKPVQAQAPAIPDSSAWTQVGGKKSAPAPAAAAATPVTQSTPSTDLLDTFAPNDSDNEKIQQSTTLGDSWESIPHGAMAPEPEWNQVKKKTRGARKAEDSDAPKSNDESKPKPKPVAPEPVKQAKVPKHVAKPVMSKKGSSNNFSVLDTSASDTRTTSGSDWAEIENIENWAVHPESSDY